MNKKYNLEYQYQQYLQKVKLKESDMPVTQSKELRQAFMGGCGAAIVLFAYELPEEKENKAIAIMENLIKQVGDYFKSVTKIFDNRLN